MATYNHVCITGFYLHVCVLQSSTSISRVSSHGFPQVSLAVTSSLQKPHGL